MRSGRRSVLGGGVALLVAALTALPAVADDTTVTFTVTAGALDITVPGSASLGPGAPGGVINGQLGVVTVTDLRASANASWTVTVTSTDFTTGAGAASQTTLATEVDYWSGPAITTTGNGDFTPGQLAAGDRVPLNNAPTTVTAFTHSGGTGNNTVTWNPTLSVRVPLDSQAGAYTGTVTHSVA
ncbi:hypothetical protein [Actinophytocola sp.]|uniref:hypothetical protein n=1 Tax=Actinophytocola sp. TaxID=1872138 RepID=UPI002ED077F4